MVISVPEIMSEKRTRFKSEISFIEKTDIPGSTDIISKIFDSNFSNFNNHEFTNTLLHFDIKTNKVDFKTFGQLMESQNICGSLVQGIIENIKF